MNFTRHFQEFASAFHFGNSYPAEDKMVEMLYFPFKSQCEYMVSGENNAAIETDFVSENECFEYPVFINRQHKNNDRVIILLHGLNERSWSKYLPWAEFLCKETGSPVILFPIAYHQNRSPLSWTNPRFLKQFMDSRRMNTGNHRSLSFANLALSLRLSEKPIRFYNSGRQTYYDIVKLIRQIKNGQHSLFKENAQIDFFGYSIGAFLAQILLMGNAGNMLSETRLFMFCGGSVFDRMSGESRNIMDKISFDQLLQYYQVEFTSKYAEIRQQDPLAELFFTMLSAPNNKEMRTDFFQSKRSQIKGISLALDTVIPYRGVVEAMGHACASGQIALVDFPFDYTHENPFPVYQDATSEEVNKSFNFVFNQAVEFLSH